jgi:D-alanine transaminase
MSSYAFYNGEFGKREDIRIPLTERSIFFGDAVYDAAIGSFDRILWEDEHINRLLSNAKRIGINHPYNKKMLSAILREIAIKSMNEVYFIYIQISQSSSSRTHSAANCKSNLLITVDPFENHADKTPLSLMRLPSMRQPTRGAAEGTRSATKIVTTMGNTIFSVLETGRSSLITISRSFFVVRSFMIGG